MATKTKSVTETQLNKWKEKYGARLKCFEVKDGNKKYVAYFAKPTLSIVQAADAEHANDPIERNLFQFNQCFLDGDEEFKNDDEFKFALANAIARSFRLLTGEVKNV